MTIQNLTTGQKLGLLEMLGLQTSPMTPSEKKLFSDLKKEQNKILTALNKISKRIVECSNKISKYTGGYYHNYIKMYDWEGKLSNAYKEEERLLSMAITETKDKL